MAVSRPLFGQRRSVALAIVGVVLYTLLPGASGVQAVILSHLGAQPYGRLGAPAGGEAG
jgi:hypothetical protein